MDPVTQSQATKAGQTLRRFYRGDPRATAEDAVRARETIERFRADHVNPLASVNNSLRSALRTEACPGEVTQRLKRMSTILDKIQREPTLALGKMQDIGGVRAVVDTMEQVRTVERRIKKNREVVGYSDYISTPRSSGYRGVHLVILSGGSDIKRQIEIQLRTVLMHEWALTVENVSSAAGVNLKRDGDTPIQQFLALAADAMAYEDRGQTPPDDLLRRLEERRAATGPLAREGR